MHSRQTHALLEAYLKVWTQSVASSGREDSPSLDIYDLFAGTGWCVEREHLRDEWPGTALVAAGQLRVYPSKGPCYLYLNSWAEDEAWQAASLEALRFRVETLGSDRPDREVSYWSRSLAEVLPAALEKHSERGRYPSLWVLDPGSPSALPWNAVREIASHERTYRDRSGELRRRRPELFINLMTGSLEQNIRQLPMVTSALGCSAPEWGAHLEEVVAGGGSLLDALTTFYIRQVESAYGRRPFVVPVRGKDGTPVSMIFLAVERDAAWLALRRESVADFEDWPSAKYEPREEWVRSMPKIDRILPEDQRRRDLEDFSP